MIRAHIRFNTPISVDKFVRALNSDGTTDKYTIENEDRDYKVNARSLLGVIYMSTEFNDNTYIVNETQDGFFPHFIDDYRI